ncbi:MAG: T9SS type A sorting domain-containing protein [Bacteroidetes bacterium]|nr:T9SS type A sorting domain-containing protein [Bacteroidota bacterium]
MKKLYPLLFIAVVTLSGVEGTFTASAQLVYKDVAGIFYNRCTVCHHNGGGAPFSMMDYSETSPWCPQIKADLNSGKMPVWPPDTTYTRFLHERIITTSEKATILQWITDGCQGGDTTKAPAAPVYTKIQLYGTPSLILKIPTFTSNASSADAYDCFALATGLTQDRYLRAFEIIPGNPAIVHHVVVSVDTTGTVTDNTSGTCYNQPGQFGIGGYAPGAGPTVFPGVAPLKMGMRIKAGSKLVLQIHYPVGSGGKQDSTQIRLYFYPTSTTGIRETYSTVFLQNWSLFIPANTTQTFTAKYPSSGGLTAALSLYSAFPHCHEVCTSLVNYADNGTNTIPLIRENKWDFKWQGYYTYKYLVKVPVGYTLRSSHVYDNTTANPNNPNSPPQLVTAGQTTKDEMLFDAFMWMYYQNGDENIDIGGLLANDSLLNPPPTSVNEFYFASGLTSFAYPNPFADKIHIGYQLRNSSRVTVEVYTIFGSKVKTLLSKDVKAGANDVEWNGTNDEGVKVPDGIYFYVIRAGKSENSGKIVLMPR